MGHFVTSRRDDDDDDDLQRAPRGVHDEPDDLWLPRLVDKRLVEAARVILRTGGAIGPKGYGTSLPRELLEAASEEPEVTPEERKHVRIPLTPRRMTLVEAAADWPMRYIPDEQDGPRRVLALYLRCKAYRRPFKKAVENRKWSRATAYRKRDTALRLIAEGLNRDGVRIEV